MAKKINEIDLSNFDSISGSQKIYVTKEADSYEWSFDAPAYITDPDNSLLEGNYSTDNWLNIFEIMPEIFAPINEIASRVSSLNFVLKKESDDQIVWDNKKFNELFLSPNPFVDFKRHIWQAVVYEILLGASFQYMNRPTGLKSVSPSFDSIKTIVNIPTNKVKIDVVDNFDPYTSTELSDIVKRIYIKRANGTDRDFDLKNVISIMNPCIKSGASFNKFKADVKALTPIVMNLIPVYMARNQIYVKRGALGFIVSRKKDASGSVALTPKEKRDMQEEYQKSYGVTGQSSAFAIASNEVDFVKTSASIQEMQPFEETETDARAAYTVLRVPKHLCPTKSNSTFNNVDADMKTFYLDVIVPKGERYAQVFTKAFDIPGHYIAIDTSNVTFLEENKKDRADTNRTDGETYDKRFRNGVCTLNEWVVSTGGERSTDPIYDKRLLEMSPEEVNRVKEILNFNIIKNENTEQPTNG